MTKNQSRFINLLNKKMQNRVRLSMGIPLDVNYKQKQQVIGINPSVILADGIVIQ